MRTQVENTQFKVHQGLLSRRSSVFEGMFSLAQPGQMEGELVDGCPVVVLSDLASDWTCILEALYDGHA